MSAERALDVDLEANRAAVTVTVEVTEVFDENGELRLWEDSSGWNGYVREETNDGPIYYRVNTRHQDDCWLSKVRVGEQAVADAVRRHIRDREAGAAGKFVRRCSPP